MMDRLRAKRIGFIAAIVAVLAFVLLPLLVRADLKPREPRFLFFTAKWCAPCHAALNGPDSLQVWLLPEGWKIGTSVRDHIQIVDIDQRPDLAEQYGVQDLPAVVYLGHGTQAIPYRGHQTILDLMKPAKPAQHQQVTGLHSHRCPFDGTTWWHGEDQFGNQRSHTCPKCGRVVWDVHSQAAQSAEPRKPLQLFPSRQIGGCPGGVCPVPGRFRR